MIRRCSGIQKSRRSRHEISVILEDPAMTRVGVNNPLRIWNAVRQLNRVHSGNHDVVIAVYNQRGYLDPAEILRLLPAPGLNRL
ncbi:hypothetical protein D3C80_2073040 [compost metagenome]